MHRQTHWQNSYPMAVFPLIVAETMMSIDFSPFPVPTDRVKLVHPSICASKRHQSLPCLSTRGEKACVNLEKAALLRRSSYRKCLICISLLARDDDAKVFGGDTLRITDLVIDHLRFSPTSLPPLGRSNYIAILTPTADRKTNGPLFGDLISSCGGARFENAKLNWPQPPNLWLFGGKVEKLSVYPSYGKNTPRRLIWKRAGNIKSIKMPFSSRGSWFYVLFATNL